MIERSAGVGEAMVEAAGAGVSMAADPQIEVLADLARYPDFPGFAPVERSSRFVRSADSLARRFLAAYRASGGVVIPVLLAPSISG
jgi:hypothetical protein